jgi:hypothetical protein
MAKRRTKRTASDGMVANKSKNCFTPDYADYEFNAFKRENYLMTVLSLLELCTQVRVACLAPSVFLQLSEILLKVAR